MNRVLAALLAGGAGLAVLCQTACLHSPNTRLYTLEPIAPSASAGVSGVRLQLRGTHVPPQFDRLEITATPRRGPLHTYAFAQWAAPLPELVQATLATDLARRLPAGRLVNSAAPTPADAAILSFDILSLEVDRGGAQAEVNWTLSRPGQAAVSRQASLVAPAQGRGPEADARAISRLLALAADHIVQSLPAA